MDKVLTLIGAAKALDEPLIERVRTALTGAGAKTDAPAWLDPGAAADIGFEGAANDRAETAARAALGPLPIDVIAQAALTRRKMLLVADMDATIVVGETLDELADIAGIGEKVAAITARAMNGELEFAGALRERVALLRDLPATALDQVLPRMQLMSGAAALVKTMRANGAHAILVSGGFRYFTSRVRELCGFDEDMANDLEVKDGKLTGKVLEPIRGREAKRETLIATAARLGCPMELALAVGDGANDLDMLMVAGLGVAYHAKPRVAAAARTRVEHGDLSALLFAQGYKRAEFAV